MQRYKNFAKSFSLPLPEVDIVNAHNGLVTCDLSNLQPQIDKIAHLVYETVNPAKLLAPKCKQRGASLLT
jgi:hypothetical protein